MAVAETVADLRATRGRAVVAGGGTLLEVTDPAPDDLRLDTTALTGVVAYEPADLTCTVRAGTRLAEFQRALAGSGQSLPVWHPAPERATVGGLVAFGWTGVGRTLYGRLRDRVLEVHAVTGEGKLVRGGGKVVKNVTGFDLPRLFCGSLGTLGVIVELTFKVAPEPVALHARTHTAERPGELLEELSGLPAAFLAAEDGGWRGFAFAPGPQADASALLGTPAPVASETFERLATHPLLAPGTDLATPAVVCRVAVPPSALSGVLEAHPVSRAVVDAGAGVGWLGFADAVPVTGLRRDAESRGGSVVLLKAPAEVRRDLGTWGSAPPGAEIMGRLKRQFDPDGVFGNAGLPVQAGRPSDG